jgi:serine/threonine protein kinase
VRITDFGIAKIYQKENSSETSGTPGYMAPEVMCAQNHTIAVDYFALGVLCFEFMFGFVRRNINNYEFLFFYFFSFVSSLSKIMNF